MNLDKVILVNTHLESLDSIPGQSKFVGKEVFDNTRK